MHNGININGIIWIIVNLIGLIIMWNGNSRLESKKSLSGFFMVLGGLALMLFSAYIVDGIVPLLESFKTMSMPNINIFK